MSLGLHHQYGWSWTFQFPVSKHISVNPTKKGEYIHNVQKLTRLIGRKEQVDGSN